MKGEHMFAMFGIWLVESAGAIATGMPFTQGWVQRYDPDAFDGLGDVAVTLDATKAIKFPDPGAALAFWQQTSTVRPLRGDGKPNRPLTAFTVEVKEL